VVGVDYVDRVVGGVGYVEGARFCVDGCVVEAAFAFVCRKVDVAELFQAELYDLPCGLCGVVLQILGPLDLELAEFVESVVCWELEPHVVEIILR
jgi:hypothetical protein